jgi:hypothetical protein
MPDDKWIDLEHRRLDRLRAAWDQRRRRGKPPEPRTTIYVSKRPGSVLVQLRFESDDGGGGDLSEIVEPGGSFRGRS